MKNYFLLLVIFIVMLNACVDSDFIKESGADFFIEVKSGSEGEVYANNYIVTGNYAISAVTVTLPNSSETINMEAANQFNYSFVRIAEDIDFSSGLPVTGNFLVTVEYSDGEILTISEEITTDVISPANILKAEWNDANNGYEVAWNNVENADLYIVRLIRSDDVTVFNSPYIENDTTYTISPQGSGWDTNFSPSGNNLQLEISAYLLEENDNNSIQAVSRIDQDSQWTGPVF